MRCEEAMEIVILLLLIIILVLALLSGFLFFNNIKINKAIDLYLEKGKVKDLRDIISSYSQKSKEVELFLQDVQKKMEQLEGVSRVSFQKMGFVRFNPFDAVGGNQSFAVALIDNMNNGFVISSLFTQEGNRVYAKPIVNGKSDYILSEEEKEAINRAMKNHD